MERGGRKELKENTLASHSMPMTTMPARRTMVTLPMMRTSISPLSMIFRSCDLSRSLSDSQKPMTYMATATALATAKMTPIDAPKSGPSEREIKKYVPPKKKREKKKKDEIAEIAEIAENNC